MTNQSRVNDSRLKEGRDSLPNLAGNLNTDDYINAELTEAGIEIVRGNRSETEVPYSITGKLNGWELIRKWNYWVATSNSDGLPLEIATELHSKKYPDYPVSREKPETYGKVVRVMGHCGCPSPEDWGFPNAEGLEKALQITGKSQISCGELSKLFAEGRITAPRFIHTYHIDAQEGLNEFARVVKSL